MLLAVHLHEIKGFHDFEQQGNILNAVLKPSPWNNENLQCFSSLGGTLSSLTARQTFFSTHFDNAGWWFLELIPIAE